MMKIFNSLHNLTFNKMPLYRHLRNKRRFPGIAMDPSVQINGLGEFRFDANCSVNIGTHFIIPEKAMLKLGKECYVGRYVELGPTNRIEIGDYTSLQDRCIFVGDVEIGRYCLFSLNILISSGRHCFDKYPHLLIRDQDEMGISSEREGKVIIEDDCWIGVNSVIMPGVKIGKGSIIGANSVVTKDIPPYSIATGAPAAVIKKRLDFNPPHEIHYDRAVDYPYFYSGVEMSSSERIRTDELKGLFTKKKFQLALNLVHGKRIFLKIKSLAGNQTLRYQDETRSVGDNFTEISFVLSANNLNMLNFDCLSENINSRLILQKAWIE
ncbi:MAG: acyltransferase [Gammaproteobacteria bacterium]|nr:acyltransferase [Gammaproteobacteria bacterium]